MNAFFSISSSFPTRGDIFSFFPLQLSFYYAKHKNIETKHFKGIFRSQVLKAWQVSFSYNIHQNRECKASALQWYIDFLKSWKLEVSKA